MIVWSPVHRRLLRRAELALALSLLSMLLACGTREPTESSESAPFYDLVSHFDPVAATHSGSSELTVSADATRGILFLPAGSSAEYLLFVADGTTLRAESLTIRGAGAGLEVGVESDAGGVSELRTFRESARSPVVAVDLPAGTPIRLSLRSIDSAADSTAGVLLRRPQLWGVPSVVPSQPTATVSTGGVLPHVVIYLVDTLRRDRLGSYGYGRSTTPNIDSFSAAATVFLDGVGQSSWTKAAVGSIFTGVWPPVHGATGWKHKLPDSFETLAESLHNAGYQTAAFVANPNIVRQFAFDQGFEHFREIRKRSSELINQAVFDFLDEERDERPLLLYVHTMDPHAPYRPPAEWQERFAPTADQMPEWSPSWRWPLEAKPFLMDLYDGEIAYNDDSFGQLMERLREDGLYDEAIIAVTSDHGEEFKEHGRWRHGRNLHAPTLNVPFIVKLPGQRQGRVVEAPFQHIDLMPTILGVAGIEIPEAVDGRTLDRMLALDAGAPAGEGDRIFSHLRLSDSPLSHSVIDDDWKLITSVTREGVEATRLYRRSEDPGETHDLAQELPVRVAVMAGLIADKLAQASEATPAEEVPMTEELLENLRALGYLD